LNSNQNSNKIVSKENRKEKEEKSKKIEKASGSQTCPATEMARGPASHPPKLLPSPSSSSHWRMGPTWQDDFFIFLWPRSPRVLMRHSSSFNCIDA
jgi:hypothetical protein